MNRGVNETRTESEHSHFHHPPAIIVKLATVAKVCYN